MGVAGVGAGTIFGGRKAVAPDGAPSALIVTGITDTTQTFSFTIGSTNHDGHRLYISTDGGVNYTLKASVFGATSIIQATGLTAGALYYFYVVAYRGTQESTPSNTVVAWDFYWTTQSLFYLDGTIIDDAGTKYFEDKSANGRDFLITSYDFDTAWTTGFPYKSVATISAPAADAALIAADINNFLYAGDGTPNQIPVVSLFQDIDYDHKIFCKHEAQIVDSDDVETYEPRVSRMFMASDVLIGATLTQAQSYFGVPVENTTTMAWISPAGNDLTGDGSKAAPYKTLSKILTSVKTDIYIKTGSYLGGGTYSATSGIALRGTGYSLITSGAAAIGTYLSRPVTFKGLVINCDTSASNSFWMRGGVGSPTVEFCKVIKTVGSSVFLTDVGAEALGVSLKNCVVNLTGINEGIVALSGGVRHGASTFDTCYGTGFVIFHGTTLTIKNSKITEGKIACTPSGTISLINVKVTNTTVGVEVCGLRAPVDSNIQVAKVFRCMFAGKKNDSYIVYIGGPTEQAGNSIHNLEFLCNKAINTSAGAPNICHTVFLGGGIDFSVKYNEIVASNGYALVLKANEGTYTQDEPHIAYNIIKHSGPCLVSLHPKEVSGCNVVNNTIIGFSGIGNAIQFATAGTAGYAKNNVISLGGDTSNYILLASASIANSVNKNGFTLTQAIGVDDDETTVLIDANCVPASRLDDGVTIADATIGLANDYSIPDAITYKEQDANWQRGAVVL